MGENSPPVALSLNNAPGTFRLGPCMHVLSLLFQPNSCSALLTLGKVRTTAPTVLMEKSSFVWVTLRLQLCLVWEKHEEPCGHQRCVMGFSIALGFDCTCAINRARR